MALPFNAPEFKVSNPFSKELAASALLQESKTFSLSSAFLHKTTFHVNKNQLLYDKSLFVMWKVKSKEIWLNAANNNRIT